MNNKDKLIRQGDYFEKIYHDIGWLRDSIGMGSVCGSVLSRVH